MKRFLINDIGIFPFKSEIELLDFIAFRQGILIAVNAEKILHATEQTKSIINDNIGYCDGIGAVMALKKKGFKEVKKIPGCELWLKIIERYYNEKSFYLVGSKQNVIENTVKKLKEDYEDINIVNYRNGYIKNDNELDEVIRDIVIKRPDIIFVAMGSPKQELVIQQMIKVHPAIYQGLGGSFDVYTGNVERAPRWWLDHNLEFAYRLIKQPSRIKRQIHLLKFFFYLQIGKY